MITLYVLFVKEKRAFFAQVLRKSKKIPLSLFVIAENGREDKITAAKFLLS